jgi:hypothetical protein
MEKNLKPITYANAEGRQAAQAGQARGRNPYPPSGRARRMEWFEGYDKTILEQVSGTKK